MDFDDHYVLPEEHDEPQAANFEEFCEIVSEMPPKQRPSAKDRVLERLARDTELSSAALAVAVTLLTDLMWERGCVDRLGFADLALRTGRSRSAVMRALKKLKAGGHIYVESKKLSAKLNAINRYTFPHLFS